MEVLSFLLLRLKRFMEKCEVKFDMIEIEKCSEVILYHHHSVSKFYSY